MGLEVTLLVGGVLTTIIITSINISKMKSVDAKINLDSTTIKYIYDDNEVNGSLTYDEVEKYLKIVKFEQDGVEFNRLVSKRSYRYSNRFIPLTREYIYNDFETGTVLKDYMYLDSEEDNENKEIKYEVGKDLNVLEENNFSTYLLQDNNIKVSYSAKELIDFYKEKVVPTLDKPKVLNK